MGGSHHPMVDLARTFADERLFAEALITDASGEPPFALLDEMSSLGLFGTFSPSSIGGAGLEPADRHLVVEAIAGGCLTTAFIWMQHAAPAVATAGASGDLGLKAVELATGRCRGGVAFAHLLRAGDPMLIVERAGDDWMLSGVAPYVTGWGVIDVLLVAARLESSIVWLIVDAQESSTMRASPLSLAAVNASATVSIEFQQHRVDAGRLVRIDQFTDWLPAYQAGLRANGSLALGVASRCVSLLSDGTFEDELREARLALDEAGVDGLPEARARTTALAVRVASSVVASQGGRSMIVDNHAQRLAREALFLLVQGQTAEIRQHQMQMLA